VITLGRDSTICVAYASSGEPFCVKEVRNSLGYLLDSNPGRTKALKRQQERDEKRNRRRPSVPYHRRVEHIKSEYHTAISIYKPGCPVVEMFELREVKWPFRKLGFTLGYDLYMEFIPGFDLGDRTYRKSLSFPQKLDCFYQTAHALGYVHSEGYVHLDVKPSNTMVSKGRIRLIDFGVSVKRGCHLSSVRGTRGYMSPEQLLKGVVDERTDIFALGVTFNVIFGGRPLQQGKRTIEDEDIKLFAGAAFKRDVSMIVPGDDIMKRPELKTLIRDCTMPQRKDRVPDTRTLMRRLERIADGYGVKLSDLSDSA
jgi:serine/threonine protein kinase